MKVSDVHGSRTRVDRISSPAHQIATKGRQRHEESNKSNWRGVGKSPSELTPDLIRWSKVQLLEQLWTHGYTAGSADSIQRFLAVQIRTETTDAIWHSFVAIALHLCVIVVVAHWY